MTDQVNGFSVRLPAGYRQIRDKAQVRSLIRAGAASNLRLRAVLEQYAGLGDRARVFAYRLGAKGFADNVNILSEPAEGVDTNRIGEVYSQVKPALQGRLGATITGHRVERVAGRKALRVEYRLTVAQRSLRGTQVYLIHQGRALIVTVTQEASSAQAEADLIIDSLRFP